MNIVSLLYNKIQILTQKKSLVSRQKILTSSVIIPNADRQTFNLDHIALYLKKAIEQLPEKLDHHKVKLILGQEFWRYIRIELPLDIQDAAQVQYLKTELATKIGEEVKDSNFKYFINDYKGKQFACVYLLTNKTLTDLQTLLSFYDLKIEEIYPEALLVFTLFGHTLNKQKDEAALFLEYEPEFSTGLLFDSIGLIKEKTINLDSQNITKELKQFKKDQETNVARLILGGSLSSEVRQDNFTKDSGIWTNPLEKVLQNSSLKEVALKLGLEKELLTYNREISLFNFIQNKEEKKLALSLSNKSQSQPLPNITLRKARALHLGWLFKSLVLIIVTSAITFGLIKAGTMGAKYIKTATFLKAKPNRPTPTPESTKPKATPTPKITLNREDITLEILNGSGTPGLANSLETELIGKKYRVESVGNAESFDYEQTLIIAPSKAVFELISGDLKDYKVTKAKFETTNDKIVTIIIGQDLDLP